MANDLAVHVRKIDKDNYLEIIREIYDNEMICTTNMVFAKKKICDIYREYIEFYSELPAVCDICDEVLFYNSAIFDRMASIMVKYDDSAVSMIERNKALMVDGRFIYSDEEGIVEEVTEQIVSDLNYEMNMSQEALSRDEVEEILTENGFTYVLDEDDDIYTPLEYIVNGGNIILVNDCQLRFFESVYDSHYDRLYASVRSAFDKRVGTYSVIKYRAIRGNNFEKLTSRREGYDE